MELQAVRGELAELVEERMTSLGVPGVVVGILHGQEELIASFGVTNVDHALDVTDRTLFQIGSTTKTFTATALLRQVEEGRLDLDAPLQTYLPDFSLANEEWARLVTPRHLLTHTGGWDGDYLLLHPCGGRGDGVLSEVVRAMPQAPLQTRPGTLFHYNNTGFSLAGRLLEVTTAQTYETAIQELLFQPLGLASSFFLPEEVITRRFAVGHSHTSRSALKVAREWTLHRSSSAAGAIAADVYDQLRYARFQLGDGKSAGGEQLLSPDTMARMQSPQVEVGDMAEAMGISWLLGHVGGERTVAHGGGTNGQISMFQLIPARSFALVILTNSDTGGQLNAQVARLIHERVLGLVEPQPELLDLDAGALEDYVGTYEREMITLQVGRVETGLEVQVLPRTPPEGWEPSLPLPPARLGLYAPDRMIALEGPNEGGRGTLIRGSDGEIEWLRWGGRIHRRLPD